MRGGVDCVTDEEKGGLCKRGGVDCVRGAEWIA